MDNFDVSQQPLHDWLPLRKMASLVVAIMTDEIAWVKPNLRVELLAKVSQP